MTARSIVGLLAWLAISFSAAAAGGFASADAAPFYQQLARPDWAPPAWLFAPAWTVLYLLMAVAAWLVAREGLDRPEVQVAITLYLVQLVLNLGWSWIFFGWRRPGWALVEILVLLVAIVATALAFHGISPLAAWLLAPYVVWVAFAASLNAWVAFAN
jgi:tryptophan-rich sensory protein